MDALIAQIGEEEQVLLADGFEDAIVGYSAGMVPRVVYDYESCIRVLVERDGMTHEEAVEYFEFNTVRAYMSDDDGTDITPVYTHLLDPVACRTQLRKLLKRTDMFLDYVRDRLVDEEQDKGIRWLSELTNIMRCLRETREVLELDE